MTFDGMRGRAGRPNPQKETNNMKTYCINPDLLGKPCYEQVLNLARRFYCEKSGLPVPPGAPASTNVEVTVNVPANSMAYVAFPGSISFENCIEWFVARLGPVPDWLAEWAEAQSETTGCTIGGYFKKNTITVDGKSFEPCGMQLDYKRNDRLIAKQFYPNPMYAEGVSVLEGFFVGDRPVVVDVEYVVGNLVGDWGDDEFILKGKIEKPHLRIRLVPHAWDVAEIEVQPSGTSLNNASFRTGATV